MHSPTAAPAPTHLLPLLGIAISTPSLQSHDQLSLSFPCASIEDDVAAPPLLPSSTATFARADVVGVSSQQRTQQQ
ncbi:hypothetical protein BHE74_00042892 [Ensete ventricosum]|nr:hypothetical protein GW17_00042806 [Ensete ventricosum]RWW50816.1 hypothetical protein BHE74_00042892 [Ensete ventricosum]